MKTIHPAIAEHVMEENERLREVLRCIADLPMDRCSTENDYRLSAAKAIALGALSQQAEPTDTYTAVDMATAAAQGFRDGQAAVEQAAVQDEQKAPQVVAYRGDGGTLYPNKKSIDKYLPVGRAAEPLMTVAQHERIVAALTRPAQTEQQPVAWLHSRSGAVATESTKRAMEDGSVPSGYDIPLYAAPIAQTAPQHSDDAAVDRFAAAMKAKLAKSRAKGRGGWDDPNVCGVEFLAQLLVEHLGKGNTGTFEDVANFSMMLHQRGADPKVLAEASATQPKLVMPVTLGSVNADYDKGWADHAAEVVRLNAAPQPQQSALVEAAQGALTEIQAALEDAYLNAYPECCGQAHLECCGSPLQAWSEADQKTMESFAPHEEALRAALSAQGESHE